jgi:hypothetical protein
LKIKLTLYLCIFLHFNTFASTSSLTLFSIFNAEVYAESQPINSFINEFNQPLTKGDSAFTYNQFEVGVTYSAFSFGLQSRYDYVMEFDPDTALYTHIEKNDLAFENRFYTYNLKAKNATSHGVFFSYKIDFNTPKITLTPKLSIFSSKHFQDGNINGQVLADKPQGNFNIDYAFSKDRLFKSFSPQDRPKGLGVSLDIALDWQISEQLILGLAIKDLYYKSSYADAGYALGSIQDIPFQEDNEGNVYSEPAITLKTSGNNQTKDHSLTMPARYYGTLDYRISSLFSTQLAFRSIKNDQFTSLLGRWHFTDNWALMTGYENKSEAWKIGIGSQSIGINFQTDSLDFEEAYYLHFSTYLSILF